MKLKNILLSTMMLLASGTVFADAKKVCDSGSEYQKYYVNYLNGIADLLKKGPEHHAVVAGERGVADFIRNYGLKNASSRVGFRIQDLNSDCMPDLLIGTTTKEDDAVCQNVLALFTVAEDQPIIVFESSEHENFCMLDLDVFGYDSYDSSSFGVYKYIYAFRAMSIMEQYFAVTDADNTYKLDPGYYRTESVLPYDDSPVNPDSVHKLKVTADDYKAIRKNIFKKSITFRVKPMSSYENSLSEDDIKDGPYKSNKNVVLSQESEAVENIQDNDGTAAEQPAVSINYEQDVAGRYSQYDVYVADKGENSIGVMVSAGEPVKNLTVLGLTFESIDDNGHVTYDIKNMYSVDKLQPDRPLLVRLTMMGTIPNYGISYQDKQGRIKRFTITQSGMDGSLQLNPM